LRLSNAIGIGAAMVIAVILNCMFASPDRRLDATSDQRFTLALPTRRVLDSLSETVSINVLISRTDPLASPIKPLLDGYLAYSNRLSLHWTDPDRDPAIFLATQTRLGIVPGASIEGKSLTDSVIVLERGNRRSYLTIDDLLQVDAETGDVELRVEQAVLNGMRRLSEVAQPAICFTHGHRELSLSDRSSAGLSELNSLLLRNSMEPRTLELDASQRGSLAECAVLVIAEPEVAFSPWERTQVYDYRDHSGSLWIMSGTVPDESGRVRGTGLDDFLSRAGISLGNKVVIESDEKYRLPDGLGESFFARAVAHPVTRSLRRGDDGDSLRVLVSLVPPVETAPNSRVDVLLRSSKQAYATSEIGSFLSGSTRGGANGTGQELTLAVAIELGSTLSGLHRRLVVSPASLATNRALGSPTLVGNRAFVDGVLAWLRPQSAFVEVPNKTVSQLTLTDSDLTQINRFVLFVMPGAALVLGLATVAMRRRRGRKVRR
jgi:hypothetical protein